MVVTAVQLTVT